MKKIISIIFIFVFIVSFNNLANAKEIIPNQDDRDYSNVDYLNDYKSFNYIELLMDAYTLDKINQFNEILWNSTAEEDMGEIILKSPLYFYSYDGELIEEKELIIEYSVYCQLITSVRLYIDNVIIINSIISIDNIYEFKSTKSLDINEYLDGAYIAAVDKFNITYTDDLLYLRGNFSPDLFVAMTYENVIDQDIYVSKFSDLNINEIANQCGLIDSLGNRMTAFKIMGGTYEENSNIGDYTIKLRGYNQESKCVFKKIIVHVIDTDDILIAHDFNTSYNKKLSEADILNDLNIEIPYDSYLFNSDYLYLSNKKGNHRYYLTLNIDDKNIIFSGYINVYDKELPYFIKSTDVLTVDNKKYLTKNEILNNFIIYDEHDGIIDSSKIILDGYVNYLGGYKTPKEYNISLSAIDSSNNRLEHNFIINVVENIERTEIARFRIPPQYNEEPIIIEDKKEEPEEPYNPIISNNDYIINAYTTHKLTALEIQDLLISEGILDNNEIVIIESEYFKEQSPLAGNYPLSVQYENGDIEYFEIKLEEKEEIIEEKSNTGLIVGIIIGIIIFIGLAIVIIMKVYVHVKKN